MEAVDTRYVRLVHLRVAAGAVTFSTALTYELFIDRPHLNSHQSPSAVLITTDEIDYERSWFVLIAIIYRNGLSWSKAQRKHLLFFDNPIRGNY